MLTMRQQQKVTKATDPRTHKMRTVQASNVSKTVSNRCSSALKVSGAATLSTTKSKVSACAVASYAISSACDSESSLPDPPPAEEPLPELVLTDS